MYALGLGTGGEPKVEPERLTPRGIMDICTTVSTSGDLLALASYGDWP